MRGARCKLEPWRQVRDAKRDAKRDESDFIQRCLVPGVVLSEKEEARWAPLKAARAEFGEEEARRKRDKILQRRYDGHKRKLEGN